MLRLALLGAAGALVYIGAASAHVELENRQAPVGSGYKAVMRVSHGCGGSATTTIRVRIPEGVLNVKPMPKAGWKLDVKNGKFAKTFSARGAKISEGVTEISWSGGNLPSAFYDEFIFTGVISEDLQPDQSIYFPVVQECEKGVHRWIEIPTNQGAQSGQSQGAHSDDSSPAPGLRLQPRR